MENQDQEQEKEQEKKTFEQLQTEKEMSEAVQDFLNPSKAWKGKDL